MVWTRPSGEGGVGQGNGVSPQLPHPGSDWLPTHRQLTSLLAYFPPITWIPAASDFFASAGSDSGSHAF